VSDTKTTIGALFRRMRKLSRLNMAEAAGALDLSITTLSDIENDKYAKPAIPREPTPAQLAAVNTEVARQTGIAKDWLRYATEVAHALGRCHCSDSGCYPGNLSVALERVKELTDAEEELSQLKAQLTVKPAIPMFPSDEQRLDLAGEIDRIKNDPEFPGHSEDLAASLFAWFSDRYSAAPAMPPEVELAKVLETAWEAFPTYARQARAVLDLLKSKGAQAERPAATQPCDCKPNCPCVFHQANFPAPAPPPPPSQRRYLTPAVKRWSCGESTWNRAMGCSTAHALPTEAELANPGAQGEVLEDQIEELKQDAAGMRARLADWERRGREWDDLEKGLRARLGQAEVELARLREVPEEPAPAPRPFVPSAGLDSKFAALDATIDAMANAEAPGLSIWAGTVESAIKALRDLAKRAERKETP